MSAERDELVASIVIRLTRELLDAEASGKATGSRLGLGSMVPAANIRDEKPVLRLTITEVAGIVADVVLEQRGGQA